MKYVQDISEEQNSKKKLISHLLVLKDLQPSNSEKTNRPSLGILQKEILGYLFSQRTGA